ncbi:hypothetical protein METBIDRAFT_44687, partial [Metschnikowia bicuspidata var. bicuspidata NRRL YB-4993]
MIELRHKVENERISDPFSYKQYRQLMLYALQNGLQNHPQVWRTRMEYEVLSAEDLINWESAIDSNLSGCQASDEKSTMYNLIATEYPTMQNVLKSLDYLNPTMAQLQQCYAKHKDNFVYSQVIFDRLLASLCADEDWLAIRALYESRLKVPHRQIQDTYDSFSSFVSEHYPQEYTLIMRTASKLLRATERSQRYYEILEQAISDDPNSPEPWIRYMTQLHQYSNGESPYPAFLAVFYRSLFAGSLCKMGDSQWTDVWLVALQFLSKPQMHHSLERKRIATSFVKCYPKFPRAYSELACSLSTEKEVHSLRNHV